MSTQQLFDFPLRSVMTFDTFITCHGNAGALHFAKKIADPADPEKLLYLHGPSGSGKSHLLSAVCKKISETASRPVFQLSCSKISHQNDIINSFANSPALLLDDLDQLQDSDDLRGAVWEVFNDFYISGLPIMVTGNSSPKELTTMNNHLISRLLWGLVATSDPSDDNSRRMIIKKIADDRNVMVSDDVVEFLLVTTSREVGCLIASFEQLYRYSLATKRKISLALARSLRERVIEGLLP